MTKPADELTAKAREQFKCNHCAGSGRVMMGALTSAVCPTCDGFGSKRLKLTEIVEALASERSSAIKEAREECARMLCIACSAPGTWKPSELVEHKWMHKRVHPINEEHVTMWPCAAAAIRALGER